VVPVGEQFDLGFLEVLPFVTLAVCAAEGRWILWAGPSHPAFRCLGIVTPRV